MVILISVIREISYNSNNNNNNTLGVSVKNYEPQSRSPHRLQKAAGGGADRRECSFGIPPIKQANPKRKV